MKQLNNFIHKPLLFHIGNFLILLSLFGFTFTYFPIARLYLFPQKSVSALTVQSKEYLLTIPKINASAPIITQVDPWNEAEYNNALKQGVAHAKGTALPNERGMSFLFAHSSGLPWELTRFNTIFYRIGELTKGDTIVITQGEKNYTFTVYDKKEVFPDEVEYLTKSKENILILQTCTPIGTSLKRLLVFAKKNAE